MCGICGVVIHASGSPGVDPARLLRMRDAMAHRGPDGAGQWISPDGKVGLGHRRLAIIDLSDAAAQPMSNEDGTLWTVFNGEIYNHADIRRELEQIGGHHWKTHHSDTEVILHAFEQWGIDCVHRFRGMFAFAIWDVRRRELWLARDRLGVKPLYFSHRAGRFTFASEVKALLEDADQPRRVNEEALFHYLSFMTTPAPMTMFEGIGKLPCGTWMRVDAAGRTELRTYWDVLDHARPLDEQTDDAVAARLLAELRRSVQLRKVSDVPVGVFLSGGIDSSTNAVLFAENEHRPLKTFTIDYDRAYSTNASESAYAQAVARLVGAEYHERKLGLEDLLQFLEPMVHYQDEPIADPVCMPVYYVSQLARQCGVTVCQVGEGADELFCGYPAWRSSLRLQKWLGGRLGRWAAAAGHKTLDLLGRGDLMLHEQFFRAACEQPIFWGGAVALTTWQKQRVLSPRLKQQFAGHSSWEALRPLYQSFQQQAWQPTPLAWMSYVDLKLRLPELLLMRMDKMSMAVGLEARVPFLDHVFVETAMSIPSSMNLRGGELKYILKRAVRGLIPDENIDRRKQGFGVPIHDWFLDRLGPFARSTLDQFCRQTDYFDPLEVRRMFEKRKSRRIWFLLNFALWWNTFIGGQSSAMTTRAAA